MTKFVEFIARSDKNIKINTSIHNSHISTRSWKGFYFIKFWFCRPQIRVVYYSGTPLYRHPLNTDIPILQTVLFVPTKGSYISLKNNPTYYRHPLIRTTDTFLCPEWQTLIDREPRFTATVYMNTVYSHWQDSCSSYHFRAGVGHLVSAFLHALKYSSLSGQMQ